MIWAIEQHYLILSLLLWDYLEKNNDATLEELANLLYSATGVRVGKSTIGRISQKLNYSLKKRTARLEETSK